MSVAIDATATTLVVSGSQFRTEREALAGFLASYSNERTREAYEYDLRRFSEFCAEHGLGLFDLKRPHIELYLRELEQRYAPATTCRRLTVLKSFFAYCVDEEITDRNPCVRVKTPKIPEKEQPHIRGLDCEAFLKAAEAMGPKMHAMACLMLLSGLRVSEVCSSRIENIDEERGMTTLTFIGKGTKFAKIPLAPVTAYSIRSYIGDRTTGPIFLRRDGNQLDRRTAWAWVRRIAKSAGIEQHVSPHALRRSAITALFDNKVPGRDVQHFARHSDPRTTAKYDQSRFSMEANATFTLQAVLSRG